MLSHAGEFRLAMLTCPVCDTPNEDGSVSCEHCNSVLQAEDEQTVVSSKKRDDQATVAATNAFSQGAAPARAFSSELPAGTVLIGRYEILERLGQGGMGTVYRVQDHELDRLIALKTIRPDLASNATALRRLKQETLLARQIAHRNVIRVFDLGVAQGLRFITMEYVEGRDLKSILELRKKLPPDDVIQILSQICEGLEAAHSEGVVHRDLKPQNVLVSAGNRIRIVDFGLARSFEDSGITHTGTILGTPTYMSPEQALGKQGDARSDIFSIGVIGFELLTGQLPFPSKTLSESLISRTRGKARPIEIVDPGLPAWLARIVMRCLERDPSERYASAQDIVNDLASRDMCAYTPLAAGTLAPGTMVGTRYRIEAEAGEGGMGKVYRAMDLDLHRTVALKVVRPDLANSQTTLDQLKHEISIASQITHKNVLRVHDLGEASGVRYISMAWAEGEDLGSLLKRSAPMPESQILQLATEICEGLEAAHEQGVSHRDLKPSNILLSSGGHPCIADFGLAHSLRPNVLPKPGNAEGSLSESTSGTPRYMSPEQVDGVCIDHRTDIYSLGLILYEMATGRIPFDDDSALQTMAQRLTEKPASPKLSNPALSDKLTAIILRCLEQDPKQRYADVRELLAALHQEAEQVTAPATSRRSAPVWLIGGIALVVLVAAGSWLWRQRAQKAAIPPRGKYIAVLPFRAIGGDPNLKYRAEGIADAISARLATLGSLHPISTSALEKVSLSQPEEAIGKQLGANLLVRGTLQGEGERIKVDTQVYDIAKGEAIWSKSYERVVGDLFTLEDEISNDTETALDVKPTIEERERAEPAPTQNLAAYDLYLKGRDILKKHRDAGNAKAALDLFEQALKKDDSFALAWTGVSDASLLLYRITNDSLYASRALTAAQEARARNSNLPEVHFALGSVYTATGRNAEAVSEIKQALKLSPNSDDGYIRLGRAYRATGQGEESLAALKKAVQLNPYYWFNHNQLGSGYYHLGRNEEARQEFEEQVAENPDNEDGYNNLAGTYLQQAQWKKAIPVLEKAIQIAPTTFEYSNLATAYYQLDKYKEAIPLYEKALALNPNDAEVVRNLAEAYAHDGQRQKADETYDRAISLLYNNQLAINPRDAQAFGTLAMCFAGRGDTAKARQFILRARSIDNSDSGLMYDEAFINTRDGRIPEALKALESALENGYSFEYCLSDPDLKTLRDAPGFRALKKKFAQTNEGRRR